MITGFNTDIVYQGVTYHVQTEDKGLETPLILSLVYDRGTILASKRSPYDDLLAGDFSEKELAERLQRQHKLICAAVRAGRLEDLKQMTRKESAAKRAQKEAQTPVAASPAAQAPAEQARNETPDRLPVQPPPPPSRPAPPVAETAARSDRKAAKVEKKIDDLPPAPQILHAPPPAAAGSPAEKSPPPAAAAESFAPGGELPSDVENEVWEIPLSILEDLIIEEVQVVEDEMILPAEAVAVVDAAAPPAVRQETPPPMIPKHPAEAEEKLKIELLNEVSFKSGERKTLTVLVKGGGAKSQKNVLGGAHVMVKILGSTFRPQVFHAKTDSNGIATVNLQLPKFSRGRAAVLIRAMSGGEETELRRVIAHD